MKHDHPVISRLIDLLGSDQVLVDQDSKLQFGQDLSRKYQPNPLAIVFPVNEQQLLGIVHLANETNTALVPSGGRTGYSGGAVAIGGELVVACDKMNQIVDFNAKDNTLRCQAGVTTKAIQDFARQHQLFYPVDFASVDKSQIGGNIATNAGGIKVIRYGLTRNWVAGLRVITGNGELLDLNHGLIKNACGFDLRHLFIGSEGTLGFISEATIKLTNQPNLPKVILLAVNHQDNLINLCQLFSQLHSLSAFEFFSARAANYAMKASADLKLPFTVSAPYYVLLEYESTQTEEHLVQKLVQRCLGESLASEAVISFDQPQQLNFWAIRKGISMSLLKYCPYKFDIAVLPSSIPIFMQEADQLLHAIFPKFEIIWFGHVGDGNLHLNLLKPEAMDNEEFIGICSQLSHQVYQLVEKYHGSVSAEHGVGLLKKEYVMYSKSPEEINYMRAIRKLFDKNNIMNPLKLV